MTGPLPPRHPERSPSVIPSVATDLLFNRGTHTIQNDTEAGTREKADSSLRSE